jgi:GDP-4-dehydro-6-deoxy-D-mannose reductase
VTGASGFVGRHLLQLLDSPENEVHGTSFPHAPPSWDLSCENNIRHLDIRDKKRLTKAIAQAQPQWVFHLAAVSNVGYSWKNRAETLETNLIGTQHVFEAVREHVPQARVLFVSSSNVYAQRTGDNVVLSEDDPVEAVSPYAYSKLCGELMSRFYSAVEDLAVILTRAFPHTGPGQSPDFVCSDWASQIVAIERDQAEPIVRVGNIAVRRDFCDVRDVVKAYVLLLEKGTAGETYNIASGRAVALEEILETLLSLSPVEVKVEVDPQKMRKADILSLRGDADKIRQDTGWQSRIPLEDTLRDLLDTWRKTF